MLRTFLFALLLVAGSARAGDFRAPFLVDYDEEVDGSELALYRTAILSHRAHITKADTAKTAGTRILGYISVGELDAEDAALPGAKSQEIIGRNEAWDSALPDLTKPAWSDWIVNVCAPRVAARGWDGFFLDTLDSARLPEGLSEAEYRRREKAVADILRRLRAKYPRMTVIANRGFDSLRLAPETFDGVMAEGVLSSYGEKNTYGRVSKEETAGLRRELDGWKARGKRVLALDYCDPLKPGEAAAVERGLSGFGYEALVATPDLQHGSALAPLRRQANRALVIFGRDRGKGVTDHPAESLVRTTLLHPLMWHGYNLEYHDAYDAGFPDDLAAYDLVVIEPFALKTPGDIDAAAKLVAARMTSGKKTLFLGNLDIWSGTPTAWETLSQAAHWTGSGEEVRPAGELRRVTADPKLMHAEAGAHPRSSESFCDIRASDTATVLLRQAAGTGAKEQVFDSAFADRFGGVLLAPWVNEQTPDGKLLARTDFFAFADRALGEAPAVFDTTTRAGCRMFFAHVDGDGFHALSKVVSGKRSAEIMRDEIFKKYAMPFTSSVIVGEMRGMTEPRCDEKETGIRQALARDIFALPNVEVASHSFRHPFAWTQDNSTSGDYEKPGLTLLPEFDHPVDYKEETADSVEYINKHLTTPDKPCRLFLWSGNCLPPIEAIRDLDAIGLPNMNGLATAATNDTPYLSAVQGGSVIRDGVVQVGAPFENDNVYYDMEKDGLEGGFARVTEAFELTGKPRRLLPVDAYWHFFSADTTERLRALKHVLDWIARRPLHPVYASEYARLMRDLPKSNIYTDTRGGTIFLPPADCRTIRYTTPVHIDMARSTGVLGYRQELGVTYVHTDGSPLVRVFTRDSDDRQPRLVYATVRLAIRRDAGSWTVKFSGFGPGRARFEGFAPGAEFALRGETRRIDAAGDLELEVRPGDTLVLPVRRGTK